MKAFDLVKFALEMTDSGIKTMVKDLHHAPLSQSTPGGKAGDGNHPIWLMGHLAYVEGSLRPILLGEANPVEEWAPLFATGTKPTPDASKYPSLQEVIDRYAELRSGTLRLLESLGDDGLDAPPRQVPAGFEDAFRTVGHTMLVIALHQMVHYGEMADARRAAGLPPLL